MILENIEAIEHIPPAVPVSWADPDFQIFLPMF
jgi:hypothetical protein